MPHFTTKAAGIDNIALFSQYISLMGLVEDKIVDCFRNGGGYPIPSIPVFSHFKQKKPLEYLIQD